MIYLIDMDGEVVHLWFVKPSLTKGKETGNKGTRTMHAKYIGNGHIIYMSDWLTELDWEGNLVWHYRPEGVESDPHGGAGLVAWDPKYQIITAHHDFQRLDNGNTLILARETVKNPEVSDYPIASDYFVEITPEGKLVWVWHTDEHFEEFDFSEEAKHLLKTKRVSQSSVGEDLFHTNTLEVLADTPLGRRDSRFHKGNILSSQRNTNIIYIIDKSTGKVVWKWGKEQLVGQHHPNMLSSGNILIYDNGGRAGYPMKTRFYTRLIEIEPATGKIVWEYRYEPTQIFPGKFLSVAWGSVQRLPNGNTLSLDTIHGRLFEITSDGEIVWEYINGYPGQYSDAKGRNCIQTGAYRCYRIPYQDVPNFS